MGVVRFYHIENAAEGLAATAAVDAVVPRLLAKILASGQQALVLCPNENRTTRLDESLWTAEPESFLPHAIVGENSLIPATRLPTQPVLLTTPEDITWPHLLTTGRLPLLLAGAEAALSPALAALGTATPLLYLFPAAPAALATAREHWQALKKQGHALEYWQQTGGKWQRKQVVAATPVAAAA